MTNQAKHVANVKVGRVKGNSRIYPQLRVPSQYVDFVGKTASVYAVEEGAGKTAFVISFDDEGHNKDYLGAQESEKVSKTLENSKCQIKPCRGS